MGILVSAAQQSSRKRNWNIKRLRGAWYLFGDVNSREGMIAADNALEVLGAEKESVRQQRRMTEQREYLKETAQ